MIKTSAAARQAHTAVFQQQLAGRGKIQRLVPGTFQYIVKRHRLNTTGTISSPVSAPTSSLGDSTFRVVDTVFEVWNETTQLYHPYYAFGNNGQVHAAISDGDVSPNGPNIIMMTSGTQSWRVVNKNFLLWNPSTSKYHEFYPYGQDGAIATAWSDGSDDPEPASQPLTLNDPDADYRFINGGVTFQKWNPITEKYHTLYLNGHNGSVREVWGAGEV